MDFKSGIVHTGNWARFRKALARAEAGEAITVGFIGGSITQGSLASAPEHCYAYLVYDWFRARFANVHYCNAGIGGTTSQFGAARVQEDLLDRNPDVVFIEFSVNDENTLHFQETYEGLVRRVLKSGAAAVLIHNICYDTGISAEDVHSPIGKHYDLPCVSVRSSIYPAVLAGEIPNREITPDDLHPNDKGHAMLAGLIIHLLDRVLGDCRTWQDPALPEPLTSNAYEDSIRWQNHNAAPETEGFAADHTPQGHITEMFRRGYTAGKVGDKITFRIPGTGIAVQYRKSVKKTAPIARVTVDGEYTAVLDANFRENWGDCLYLETVLAHGTPGTHTVEVEIMQTHPEDQVPFYLVSLIGSGMCCE